MQVSPHFPPHTHTWFWGRFNDDRVEHSSIKGQERYLNEQLTVHELKNSTDNEQFWEKDTPKLSNEMTLPIKVMVLHIRD